MRSEATSNVGRSATSVIAAPNHFALRGRAPTPCTKHSTMRRQFVIVPSNFVRRPKIDTSFCKLQTTVSRPCGGPFGVFEGPCSLRFASLALVPAFRPIDVYDRPARPLESARAQRWVAVSASPVAPVAGKVVTTHEGRDVSAEQGALHVVLAWHCCPAVSKRGKC